MAPHPAANRLGLKIRADLARVFRYGERDDPVRRRLPEPFFWAQARGGGYGIDSAYPKLPLALARALWNALGFPDGVRPPLSRPPVRRP